MNTFGLTEFGYKIFLDRYALKDTKRETLQIEDLVLVVTNESTSQREIGYVQSIEDNDITVKLLDETIVTIPLQKLDKPLELDPKDMWKRVAKGIASVEKDTSKWEEKFYNLLEDWKFVPGGRILTAAGTNQGLTFYNCYVLPNPHDSRQGIIKTLGEMMEIMSRGGGVGINISSLRPKSAYVKGVNGRSSGSVSWGSLYSFVTGLIEQGGSRRGAGILILNDWHPDLLEFIQSKKESGKITNANISVGVSDRFMDAVKNNLEWKFQFPDTEFENYDSEWDGNLEKWLEKGYPVLDYGSKPAQEIWDILIESAWASAEPGLWFRERANKFSNSWYFNELVSTNPCLTGDTLIYTDKGIKSLKSLFDSQEEFNVVVDSRFGTLENNTHASKVFFSGNKEVFLLRTNGGYQIKATENHKFMTSNGWVELKNLKVGEKINVLNQEGCFGKEGDLEKGRVIGWYIGDGYITGDESAVLAFYDKKRELSLDFSEYVQNMVKDEGRLNREYTTNANSIDNRNVDIVCSTRLYRVLDRYGIIEEKLKVPQIIFEGTRDMQIGFLQGLFSADGYFQNSKNSSCSIRLTSISIKLLEGVQLLLSNFGIRSRIYLNRRNSGYRELPDGKGGLKEYFCQDVHEISISKEGISNFAHLIGFLIEEKQSYLENYISEMKKGFYVESYSDKIESISLIGKEDVYDLTEPITHSFIANGLVVHNCGEIGLSAYGVCNLGAINLSEFYDPYSNDVHWGSLEETIHLAIRFLDNVVDVSPYFIDENYEVQQNERRLGLNTMGLAELLIKLGIRYGSQESLHFIDSLYEFIQYHAHMESIELAKEKGSFKTFDYIPYSQSKYVETLPSSVKENIQNYGIRNVALLTQAPNGTTGSLIGTSTGIEPFFAFEYWRKSRLGMHKEESNLVKEWKKSHLNQELPDCFVTAMELSPEEHVKVQAQIQKYIDQSISKTSNVPNEYTIEQTKNLYQLMYDLGCKGGTIYRDGSRSEQILTLEKKEIGDKNLTIQNRPVELLGSTRSIHTGFGTCFIVMNDLPDGTPFEVFITIGKAGSELQACAEALGRAISFHLRSTAEEKRLDVIKGYIDQWENIGGSNPFGMGIKKVSSLPDAIAIALRDHYFGNKDNELIVEVKTTSLKGDICTECGSATLIREEGCYKCTTCAYSRC